MGRAAQRRPLRARSGTRSLWGSAEAVPGVDQAARGTVGIVAQLVLPNDMYLPAAILQRVPDAHVAFDIAPELLGPERGIRSRPRQVAARTRMPEAAVDEHGEPLPRKGEVRAAREGRRRDPIAAHAQGPQITPEPVLEA
jgi:hypothetical protein